MKYILLLTALLSSGVFASVYDYAMGLAKQGKSVDQYLLAVMYDSGNYVSENDVEAVKWYRKAANQGFRAAQVRLGQKYALGEGIPENSIKAYVWWSMAKTQGSMDAAHNLDILKSEMTMQQIAEAQALAVTCYESNYKDCN